MRTRPARPMRRWWTACSPRPRYGERWARHWLDVVHYGETTATAWIVRAQRLALPRLRHPPFNDDKPYARFVQEQMAGDVLFPDEPRPDRGPRLPRRRAVQSERPGRADRRHDCKKMALNLDRDDMASSVTSTFASVTLTAPAATITSSTRSPRRITTACRRCSPAWTASTGRTTGPRGVDTPAALTREKAALNAPRPMAAPWRRARGKRRTSRNLKKLSTRTAPGGRRWNRLPSASESGSVLTQEPDGSVSSAAPPRATRTPSWPAPTFSGSPRCASKC